jgi:hypothetical protein
MAIKNRSGSVFAWLLKNISGLISLGALLVSVGTFIMVYAWPGKLEVLLPRSIAFGTDPSTQKVIALVPATFSNTGAPRTMRHIRYISCNVYSLDPNVKLEGRAGWLYERKCVGWSEYLKRYPNEKTSLDKGQTDFLNYEGRAVPFTVSGGASVTKVLELEMQSKYNGNLPSQESLWGQT